MKKLILALFTATACYATGVSVAVAPSFGSGMGPQTYTVTAYDSSGYADITELDWVMNAGPSLSTVNACYVQFTYPSTFNLVADSGSGAASGSPQSNSQCTLNSSSVITTTGTSLQYNISVTFKPSWIGVKRAWVDANSTTYGTTGAVVSGSWTVTPNNSGSAAQFNAHQSGATYAQNIEHFFQEYGSPFQFGSIDATGTTDAGPSIQSALDQLSGNELRFPCGTYRVDNQLEIHQTGAAATRIIGASKGCVTFQNTTGNLIWHYSAMASTYYYLQGPDFEHFTCRAKNCIRIGDYYSGSGPTAANGPPYVQAILHPVVKDVDFFGTYQTTGNIDPDFESNVIPATPDTLKAYGVGLGITTSNNASLSHLAFTGYGVGLELNATDMTNADEAMWFQSNARAVQIDTYGLFGTDQYAGPLGNGARFHGWQVLCTHRYGGITLDHVGNTLLEDGYFENCTGGLAQSYLYTNSDSFSQFSGIMWTQNLSVPMYDLSPTNVDVMTRNQGNFFYNTGSTGKVHDTYWQFQAPMLLECRGNGRGFPCPTQILGGLSQQNGIDSSFSPFIQKTETLDSYEFNPSNMLEVNCGFSTVTHPWVVDSVTGHWVLAASYICSHFPLKRSDDRAFVFHYTARAGAAFSSIGIAYNDIPLHVTAVTTGANCVLTIPGHYFVVGDYITPAALTGVTGCQSGSYAITVVAGSVVTLGGVTTSGTYTGSAGTASLGGGLPLTPVGTCTPSTLNSVTCNWYLTLPAHARANSDLFVNFLDTSQEFVESFGFDPITGDPTCFAPAGLRISGPWTSGGTDCTWPGQFNAQGALVSEGGVSALMETGSGANYDCLGYSPYSGSFGYNARHAFCSGSNIDGANRHVLSLRCIYLGSCQTQLAMDSHGYLQINQVSVGSLTSPDTSNAAVVFATGATPGTSPCASGGSGAWAFWRQGSGIWDCMAQVNNPGPFIGTYGSFTGNVDATSFSVSGTPVLNCTPHTTPLAKLTTLGTNGSITVDATCHVTSVDPT